MRTPLALLLGSLLVGCTVGDPGTGGDDDGGAVCGDGVKEGTEACDDGNTAGGDGCSAVCSVEQGANPRVTASLDKQIVATELGKVETLEVTFTSVEGFEGTVNLTPSVDYGTATGAWVLTPSNPSVDLTAGGTAKITVQVAVPSDSAALTGTVKLDATSSAESVNLTSAFTVANQYTLVIPAGVGAAIPHAGVGPNSLRLRSGAKLIFHNQDTIVHRIHASGGIPHEGIDGGQPGGKYEVTPSGNSTWYCHTHNEDNAKTYNISIVQ